MTSFHGPFVTHQNIFFEVMTGRDRETFVLAFSKGEPNGGSDFKKLSEARRWVDDVIRLWADKIGINHGLAFKVVCTGSADAVRRHYAKRLEKHKATLPHVYEQIKTASDEKKSLLLDDFHKVEAGLKGWVELDYVNLAESLRRPFVDLLSLRHPTTKIFDGGNHYAAHVKAAKPANQEKIGDGKPRRTSAKAKDKRKPDVGMKGDRQFEKSLMQARLATVGLH